MRHYIFSLANVLAIAITEDTISHALPADAEDDDRQAEELAARKIALDRFREGLWAVPECRRPVAETLTPGDLTLLACVDPEKDFPNGDPDEFADMGIPDQLAKVIAQEVLDGDNASVDDDCEFSGLNVQSWSFISAEAALESLTNRALPYQGEVPHLDRRTKAEAPYQQLKPLVDALLLQLETNPGDGAAIKRLTDAIKGLESASATPATITAVIQSWEVGEKSDQDFSPDQRKPWQLKVELKGSQLHLALWPLGQDEQDSQEGFGALLEINKGRPALHLSPSPYSDNAMHIHSLGNGVVEVVPNTDWPPHVPSEPYPGSQALRFEGRV